MAPSKQKTTKKAEPKAKTEPKKPAKTGVNLKWKKKIERVKGTPISQFDAQVAKILCEIENNASDSLKVDAANAKILKTQMVEFGPSDNQKCLVVTFPYRIYKTHIAKHYSKFVADLEKKMKCFVILTAARAIISQNSYRRKGIKIRPRSRTLTSVHESILEDVCGQTEIVGKRLRVCPDGSKLMKILLDPKAKAGSNLEEKLSSLAAVYKKLTNKDVVFMFNQ